MANAGSGTDGVNWNGSSFQSTSATFRWHIRPVTGRFAGTVYTDGSIFDRKLCSKQKKSGWAFVVLDGFGQVVAAASGKPPRCIRTSTAIEAWAFYMAVLHATPGCSYRMDCQNCVRIFHRGKEFLAAHKRPTEMLWERIFDAIVEGKQTTEVTWMPAHTKRWEIGKARLGNGEFLTATDRRGNAMADALAKIAAKSSLRFPKHIRPQDLVFKGEIRVITAPTVLLRSRAQIEAARRNIGRAEMLCGLSWS